MNGFSQLVSTIQDLHHKLQHSAVNAVNQMLTIRNWLTGYYIVEFEQNGKDRAEYGSSLLVTLSEKVKIRGLTAPELSRCRQFYKTYPGILGTVSQEFRNTLPEKILGTASQESAMQGISGKKLSLSPKNIISKLSFSHLTELIKIEDDLKRTFYEIEAIKGVWSVRELRRQINSLYFERSSLSKNPEKLSEMIRQKTTPQANADIIKNIYAFEFLNLPIKEILEESDFEKALLDNLQQFIIEMGYGFCFEARQKRILIGEKYYFIDLVFYHRILKCHVLIDLKIGEFEHGDIGQINTYLNYFKEEICEPADNLPIGILMVAEKDSALVKYATAGLEENLFVKKYMLKLPDANVLKQYMEKELKALNR
jgi:predicted nuclease of restriction endonuclease-like (RecB) superfamily